MFGVQRLRIIILSYYLLLGSWALLDVFCDCLQVNKQGKTQLKRLQTMRSFLNEHKDKQDSFNDWLKKAEGQIQSATRLVSDLENLQQYAEELEVRVCPTSSTLFTSLFMDPTVVPIRPLILYQLQK